MASRCSASKIHHRFFFSRDVSSAQMPSCIICQRKKTKRKIDCVDSQSRRMTIIALKLRNEIEKKKTIDDATFRRTYEKITTRRGEKID